MCADGSGLAGGHPVVLVIQVEVGQFGHQLLKRSIDAEGVFIAREIGLSFLIPDPVFKFEDRQVLILSGVGLGTTLFLQIELTAAVKLDVSALAHMGVNHIILPQPHRPQFSTCPRVLGVELLVDGGELVGYFQRNFPGEPALRHLLRILIHTFHVDALLGPVHVAGADIPARVLLGQRKHLNLTAFLLDGIRVVLESFGHGNGLISHHRRVFRIQGQHSSSRRCQVALLEQAVLGVLFYILDGTFDCTAGKGLRVRCSEHDGDISVFVGCGRCRAYRTACRFKCDGSREVTKVPGSA